MSDSNSDSNIFCDELQVADSTSEFGDLIEKGNKLLVPTLSSPRYEKAYTKFQKWRQMKNPSKSVSPDLVFAYFVDLSEKVKPTSLWSYYSMIKQMLKVNKDIDILNYHKVKAFLKNRGVGYQPKKAKVFTEEEIRKFLQEAPDYEYLAMKVSIIFSCLYYIIKSLDFDNPNCTISLSFNFL